MSSDSSNKEPSEINFPSIKSSSGNDNFRTSEIEPMGDGMNKEHSMSIELADKSSEVAMFISSKELSPKDPAGKSQTSHLRNRIISIRGPGEAKICPEKEASQVDPQAEIRKEEPIETTPNTQKKLIQKFEFMKEPSMNPIDALKKNLASEAKPKTTKQLKEIREQSEVVSSSLYDLILHDIFESMFTPRVNVNYLREKHRKESEAKSEEKPTSKSFDSSDSEDDDSKEQESTEESNYSVLKIPTDSKSVKNYVAEVIDQIEKFTLKEVQENLTKPIRINDLALLRDLQGAVYDVESQSEFETKSIVNIQIYLQKERKDKAEKEKERKNLIYQMTRGTPNQMENLEITYSTLCEYQHIHNKAIFDAINEALDKHRPYGLKGCPPLWSSKTKTLTNNCLVPL